MEVSTPFSTRPGWVQVCGVEVVNRGNGVDTAVGAEVGVGGIGVCMGVNGVTGAQADRIARSVKKVEMCFVQWIASLIA